MTEDSDKASLREIARRIGRRNLSDYRAKYPDFPEPIEVVNSRRMFWSETEVRNWFEDRNLFVRARVE